VYIDLTPIDSASRCGGDGIARCKVTDVAQPIRAITFQPHARPPKGRDFANEQCSSTALLCTVGGKQEI
jgi:hypothetical protein